MQKTLFRLSDIIELCLVYVLCFSLNLLFDYSGKVFYSSFLLMTFVRRFQEYRREILFLFSFMAIVIQYQMLYRKKREIFCRILVGDYLFHIIGQYVGVNFGILFSECLFFTILDFWMNFSIQSNVCLFFLFAIYTFISIRWINQYEKL